MSYIEQNGYFIFDGVKSSDYGVWINGGGTFNAPKRRYKDYIVPGRNGTLTIDEGVFEEIEVAYPAFIARNFRVNIEAFRNQMMSRSGYMRMTDSYHPDEYYLAKYMDGLEANVLPAGVGGRFNLTFRRDPRRFLVAGETPVSVPSSGGITNPTLYASRPQIKITPKPNLLTRPFYHGSRMERGVTFTVAQDGSISVRGTATSGVSFILKYDGTPLPQGKYALSGGGGGCGILFSIRNGSSFSQKAYSTTLGAEEVFTISESESAKTTYAAIYVEGGTTVDTIVVPMLRTISGGTVTIGSQTIELGSVGEYVIVDSEIQSCYRGLNNINSQVAFTPNEFPVLKPGENGVVYSGNIESVEITPNWYRV